MWARTARWGAAPWSAAPSTATANDRVVEDVAHQLGEEVVVIRGPLARDTLHLDAIPLRDQAERLAWLAEHLPTMPGSGIVYCLTVADTHTTPVDLGSYSSRVTLMVGNAAIQAAERAKEIVAKGAAKKLEIPAALDPMPEHSGTDAYATQVAREGIPSMLLSIPLRYMHTPVEVIAIKDVQRTGRLLAEFIAGLGPDFLATITWEDEDAGT